MSIIDFDIFWGTDCDNNPPLTDSLIEGAESFLGVKLPPGFIELLRIQNGGYTHGFIFPTNHKTTWADGYVPLDDLFGIGTSGMHNILDSDYLAKEWGLPEKQVLLTGDGHWWITLDYRNGVEPVVTWLDVENDQDFELAHSFGEFINGLLRTEDVIDEDTGALKRID